MYDESKIKEALELVLWAHGINHIDADRIRKDVLKVLGYTQKEYLGATYDIQYMEDSGLELDGTYKF